MIRLTALLALALAQIPALAEAPASPTDLHLRAQLKARQSTMIASEISARISQLKLHDGERFSAGQVLVGFHCTLEEAQLSKAQATLGKKVKIFEVNQQLETRRSIGALELAVSKAEAEEARADLRIAQAMVDRCVIHAPFSGKVSEAIARPYQSVRPGDPLLEILDDKDLEVEFMASSRAMPNLAPGKHFQVTLDEVAKTYQAEITRVGGKVDPVSQTIKVYGRIIGKADELLPGMSGAIEFPANP
ncbi:MAG: efflux RND transporter periplasmic adaptor subunit [Methylobacter sp.]|uniref:efflux RND transporter periplasmic adaptor subunit n=1 Tax=Methylobacter sp. TaxID=2051955 RepID=UPI00273141F8|nr:efflux RND transporter periplasmic adaptor subunit [Methylobacter sp.]MDP1666334.1 efflux RND transporter periplasmic adaptor subunit [Methylobacter sp.]